MILYFSGTGNTRRAAFRLAKLLKETDLREFTPQMLRHPENAVVDMPDGDRRLIWAFPTYSWGIPPVVADFIKHFIPGRNISDAKHIMLTSCGDDMGLTDRQWRKLMRNRGFNTAGAYAVVMPNTYTLMKGFDVDAPELSAAKLTASEGALIAIAESVMTDGQDILVRKPFSWVKSRIIYPWFRRYAMSPKPFHTHEACISCGKCATICPMANITMEAGRPKWGDACALCLRCYHSCPRHAIAYGKATDGKGQWMCS